MFFALITFLSAFFIESIGTYISILGLSALFAFNPVIIAMAVALDVGKVVAVSFLYKSWRGINWLMKTYMTIACVVLITITSMGVFGFLSGEFQKAIATNNTQTVAITALQDEQARLQKRKEQIDLQIANLPANYGATRVKVINSFKEETKRINDRLAKIDEELPKLKIENIQKAVKIGPILYVAEAFHTTPEQAVKWVILTIIGVFDPLAIALILAGNYLWEQRRPKAQAVVVAETQPLLPPTPVIPDADMPISSPEWNAAMDESIRDRTLQEQAASEPEPEPKSELPLPIPPAPPLEVPTITEEIPENIKRSSLEDLDARRTKVYADDLNRLKTLDKLIDGYRHDIPAVTVGGPATKIDNTD